MNNTRTLGESLQARFNDAVAHRTGDALKALLYRADNGSRRVHIKSDPRRAPIPEEDLKVLEKLYHGAYGTSARKKRAAIKRYIALYRDPAPLASFPLLITAARRANNF